MARYIRNASGYNAPIAKRNKVAASKTIKEGDLVAINAGLLEPAAKDSAVVGIANEPITTTATVTDGDNISFTPITNIVVRLDYTGATKTSLTDADIGTAFNLKDARTVDLDDSASGICTLVGYDNKNKTADVVIEPVMQL